ncbi:hypothetical protein PVL29_013067 [Vitis rotundifolia]|uniref:RING-CH-type domain-containing protein n=1 Tax=Vitis rotundifolia TaxID=103349 RepID=A0AA38ZKF0_VITRO|nr:hypothetical protein PVL29_013067 [Vitis rotundifolia]
MMEGEAHDPRIGDKVDRVEGGIRESSSAEPVPDTVIVITPAEPEAEERRGSSGGSRSNEAEAEEEAEAKTETETETETEAKSKSKASVKEVNSCVVDVKCGGGGGGGGLGENWDGERVCRICHLSSEPAAEGSIATCRDASVDLIHLGCGCKDELGISHPHCAEAWFKLKGNRMCEICGETASNVRGVWDNRFMEDWNERRYAGSSSNSSDRSGGCWRGQPFCNFLMACLVIAFVLPWFFRVNMF